MRWDASCDTGAMETQGDRIDDCLIALRRILRATWLHERELAQAAGLTPAQLRVLQILNGRPDGSTTPKALATQMGVAQATITALLDKLETAGKITRRRSQADRRQSNVVITPAGRAALKNAPDALQQRFVRAFERMQDWEQAQLVASLERVAAMLNAKDIDASPVLSASDIHSADKPD
ncbi:MarR family winged helix-turn-helix transcriptional regulator [Szabonella alba]|nr:MarR family transcriptional regulator [Szabonella alba]